MSVDITLIKQLKSDTERLKYLFEFNNSTLKTPLPTIFTEEAIAILDCFTYDRSIVHALHSITTWIMDIHIASLCIFLQRASDDEIKYQMLSILIKHLDTLNSLDALVKVLSNFDSEQYRFYAFQKFLKKMNRKYSCANISQLLKIFDYNRLSVLKFLKEKISDKDYSKIIRLFPKNNQDRIAKLLGVKIKKNIAITSSPNIAKVTPFRTNNPFSFASNSPITNDPMFAQNQLSPTNAPMFTPSQQVSTNPFLPLSNNDIKNDSDDDTEEFIVEKNDDILCIICIDNNREVLLNKCSHFSLCEKCVIDITNDDKIICPKCRVENTKWKKIYM